MSPAGPHDQSPLFRPVSAVKPEPVAWLWPGYLPLGKLVLLDGDPGLGKSLVALDLCARLSTGRPLPDGSPGPGPAAALVLGGEDGGADTLRPRLDALDADPARIFFLDREGPGGADPPRFPSQVRLLEDEVARTGARLVVLDPLVAFLDPGILTSSDHSVRRALGPLALLAQKHQCTVLLIRHLNKKAGARALYRGGGSIGFAGACRAVWLLAADPEAPGRRVLAPVKNNLAAPQPSLALEVRPRPGGHPTLAWLGPRDWSADQLLKPPSPRKPGPVERGPGVLLALLADGPLPFREIRARGREQGLSERTLERAKQRLGVRSVRVWVGGARLSYWLLPGQRLPAGADPDLASEADLEAWLEARPDDPQEPE